ncbi:hypothetical protein KVG29_08875 [Caldicoprobacter algeriensis]|uniref:hypothetical protein n=1 Tax=Caldicoprobacter algeriensis TaxID=699281 RepID=UPI0020797CBD|nr:hypothetical protein [Caldicoprobacter algeriensis]MCM8901332.1 hypothetical protein [Caldicoprobacter algeriensis]
MILKISGIDYTGRLAVNSLEITDEVNARSTCRFVLISKPGEPLNISVGANIEIEHNFEKIFAGVIEEISETVPLGSNVIFYDISCSDWHSFADKRIVAEAYDNMTAGAIVRDIIAKYLAEEGITAGTIQDGPVISRAVFNYLPASQCLDELSELTGFIWVIYPDKTLNFFERAFYSAPWKLYPNSRVRNIRVTRDKKDLRNRQYIRAGKDISNYITERFKGDGETKTFHVALPIATQPTVKVNGAVQTVGITQLETGKQWYWSKGETAITQDENAIALTSADVLEVTYRGFYPIIVTAEEITSQEELRAIEGGTGIYEHIENAESIDSYEAALEYAQGKLRRYARIGTKIEFETHETGLKPGQLINIYLLEHNIADDFLITRVNIRQEYGTKNGVVYSVECVDGEAVGGWANFFKKLTQSGKSFVIRENEVLIKLLTPYDTIVVSPKLVDTMGYNLDDYPVASETTFPGVREGQRLFSIPSDIITKPITEDWFRTVLTTYPLCGTVLCSEVIYV